MTIIYPDNFYKSLLMKIFCILIAGLFFLSPTYSQMKVSGIVTDEESGNAIPCVILTDSMDRVLTQTNSDGFYNVEISPSTSLHFIHLAYDSASVRVEEPMDSCNVILKPFVFELDEVVVTPNYANNLLATAYRNLVKRLELKHTRQYKFHDKEYTTIGGEREVYALLDVGMNSINRKNGMIKWDIKLTGSNLLNQVNNENFSRKNIPFNTRFIPRQFSINPDFSNYFCEIIEENENLLTIKATSKSPDKDNYTYSLYTINRIDTMIVKSVTQAFPNTAELTQLKINGVDCNLSNTFGIITFEQDETSQKYFLSDCQHREIIQIRNDSTSHDIYYETHFSLQNEEDKGIEPLRKKKKIPLPYIHLIYEAISEQTRK